MPLKERLSAAVLAEILDGGQAFRWRRDSTGVWHGRWGAHSVRLRLNLRDGRLQWSAPPSFATEAGPALMRYLDAVRDAPALADALPWRSDPHLSVCLAAFPGLRILRQPFGETLLCFMCSSAKRIAQIKQMVALLAVHHGQPFEGGSAGAAAKADPSAEALAKAEAYRLPSWDVLALVPETALRACRLGFRARHIHRTAVFLAAHPGWLEMTEALPYAEARARLCLLPGVGEKIADCVLLFGAGRLEAFPVDVWIVKALGRRYGLEGWKPGQIAHFGRTHFGPHAGLAQQYLFAWERKENRKSGKAEKRETPDG